MVLAAYYLDGRTLAEIARMLGVHESTISRKVDKLAKSLRKKILANPCSTAWPAARPKRRWTWMSVTCRWIFAAIWRKIPRAAAFSGRKHALPGQQKVAPRAKS